MINSIASPAPDAPGSAAALEAERRASEWYVTIFRPGKITHSLGEELCLVRNISPDGAMAQVGSSFVEDEDVILDFRFEEQIHARIAWVRDGHVGLRFATPIDLSDVFAISGEDGRKPRAPRLRIPAAGRIQIERDVLQIVLTDVSQAGAKIHSSAKLSPGMEVQLSLDGLGDLHCTVRWARNGSAGVAFSRPIGIWQLAAWVRDQRGAARGQSAA